MAEFLAKVSELLTAVPQLVTLVAALSGTAVGALGTILVTWINNKSAERRHLKELVFTGAVENWKKTLEVAAQLPSPPAVAPLGDYILGLVATADLFLRRKITKDNLRQILEETDRLNKEIYEWRFEKSRRGEHTGAKQ